MIDSGIFWDKLIIINLLLTQQIIYGWSFGPGEALLQPKAAYNLLWTMATTQ